MDEVCAEEEIINLKFKIIILGDVGVGKSAICTQLCKSYFLQSYRETYGCEFYSKNYHLPGRYFVNLQVWDIGFLSLSTKMVESYIYGSNYILLVYDITKRESYNKILDLMKLAQSFLQNKKVSFGLIGNKTDLYHLHAVKMAEHAQLSESNKMKSFFMSAKTGDQINDCFISIAGELAGVSTEVKNSSLGSQQLGQQAIGNDNIEEDEEEDVDSEDEKAKKKAQMAPPPEKKKPQAAIKTSNTKEEKKEKDGFNLTQADMKKMQISGPKKTKNCEIF